jgi:PEGA domain-containing protein
VRTSKRIVVIAALGFAGALTLASTSSAQGFRGRRVVVRAPVVVGGYYSPYWLYDPWFGFGYQSPWGPYPYPYPYPYRYYNVDLGAAMRIEVTPHEAEVYLDGYYAGIVDDFNGAFQRLRARPGQHEIVLYLDGYRTVHQKLYLTPKNTIKVKYAMERLGAGEQPEARPEAPPPPLPPPPQAGQPPPMPPPGMPGRGPATRRAPQGPPRGGASAYGTLAIRVQPIDADVLIDGELWHTQEAPDRITIEVAEGPHTVEIRKAGYRPFVTEVQVRRGESTPLNVSLRAQEEQ